MRDIIQVFEGGKVGLLIKLRQRASTMSHQCRVYRVMLQLLVTLSGTYQMMKLCGQQQQQQQHNAIQVCTSK